MVETAFAHASTTPPRSLGWVATFGAFTLVNGLWWGAHASGQTTVANAVQQAAARSPTTDQRAPDAAGARSPQRTVPLTPTGLHRPP